MELERKVYDSWAFTKNEHEKGEINKNDATQCNYSRGR